MKRLSSLALLICALLVLDQVFYQGRYAETVWDGLSTQAQLINRSAQSFVARLSR
jgi:hypothetical protein